MPQMKDNVFSLYIHKIKKSLSGKLIGRLFTWFMTNVLTVRKGVPGPLWIYSHFCRKKISMISGETVRSNDRDYIYYSPSSGTHSRIDMILIDGFILISALNTPIGYMTWFGHSPVTLTLSNGSIHLVSSLWCLNMFLLRSP